MTVQSVLDEIRERPGTGEVIPVFNPATEEPLARTSTGARQATAALRPHASALRPDYSVAPFGSG